MVVHDHVIDIGRGGVTKRPSCDVSVIVSVDDRAYRGQGGEGKRGRGKKKKKKKGSYIELYRSYSR